MNLRKEHFIEQVLEGYGDDVRNREERVHSHQISRQLFRKKRKNNEIFKFSKKLANSEKSGFSRKNSSNFAEARKKPTRSLFEGEFWSVNPKENSENQ